ncbi:MAG: nucleotide exchange factor GrpE [Wenzhouxiangellaceae bacterium]|nr:nucleotide exchange factor GrpE [Wenzhouxiangellaceae bacterium]
MSQQQPPEANDRDRNHSEDRVGDAAGQEASQAYSAAEQAGAAEVGAEQSAEPVSSDDAAQAEIARLKDALLRLRADMDNREKRMQREMDKTRRFALDGLLRDLIPVLDTLDQAIQNAAVDDHTLIEGMELTRKQLLKVLDGHGVVVIDPAGERFDPSWHEAMTLRPAADGEADTVVEVLQRGYSLNERLIRPARVVVAK